MTNAVLTNRVEPLDSDLMNPVVALRIGAFFAILACAAGAFGSHFLAFQVEDGQLSPRDFELYKLGLQFHFYHAIAIAALSFGGGMVWTRHYARWAVVAWSLGIIVFSGSLYALCFTGMGYFTALAPFGGFAFVVGWILAAVGAQFYHHAPLSR